MLNTYFLIVYSDFVGSSEARYKMGWFNLAIMITQILISGGLVTINQGYTVYRALKLYYLKRKSKKRSIEYSVPDQKRQNDVQHIPLKTRTI